MTPQEAAKYLVEKFSRVTKVYCYQQNFNYAALTIAEIHCDEMEKQITKMPMQDATRAYRKEQLEYWQSVKQEINKL